MTQLIGDGHAQAQFPHEPEGGGVEDERAFSTLTFILIIVECNHNLFSQ